MRRKGPVFGGILAGILCLMVSPGLWAQLPEAANKQLFQAVLNNDLALVQQSIGEGADPRATNERGLSAIDLAVDKGFFEIAHYLLAAQNRQSAATSAPAVPAPSASVGNGRPAAAPRSPVAAAALPPAAAGPAAPEVRQPVQVMPPPLSVPPVDRELVDEPPEPITVLPVIPAEPQSPAVEVETIRPAPSAAAGQDEEEAERVAEMEPAPSQAPSLLDQIAGLFEGSGKEAGPSEATGAPASDPAQVSTALDELEAQDPLETMTAKAQNQVASERPADEVSAAQSAPLKPIQVGEIEADPAKMEPIASKGIEAKSTEPKSTEPEPVQAAGVAPETVQAAPIRTKPPSAELAVTAPESPLIPPAPRKPAPPLVAELSPSSPDVPAPKQAAPDPVRADAAPDIAPPPSQASPPPAPPPEPAEPTEQAGFFEKIGNFFSASERPASGAVSPSLDELEAFDPVASTPASEPVANDPGAKELAASAPQPVIPPDTTATFRPGAPAGQVSKRAGPQSNPSPPTAGSSNSVNPFTRLTDLILDILPDGDDPSDQPEKAPEPVEISVVSPSPGEPPSEPQEMAARPAQAGAPPGEVAYPVEDRTAPEDPYKVTPPARPAADPVPEASRETASIEPKLPVAQASPLTALDPEPIALTERDLTFGENGKLGQPLLARNLTNNKCVEKKAWNSHFCIESFQWPPAVRKAFGRPALLQGGGQSIVHYVDGKSAQYHGLFPSRAFEQIAAFLISSYGAPTERPEVWTAMLAEAKKRNRTLRWIAVANDGGRDIVLEIRQIDDLRWSAPPDKYNGVIRLYRQGDNEVFRLLTTADLLLLQVRKGNEPPSPPQAKFN